MSAAARSGPGEPQHPLRVLLIDDQALVGEAIRQMLAGEPDLDFHYLQDPRRALETAQALRPTVILQDLVMPQLDGLTLISRLREQPATRDVPLIVLSGREEPVTKVRAFELGANDYLVKLPHRLELLARVRHHSQGYISALQRDAALSELERSNRFIRATFGRYLSDEVVEALLDQPEGLRLGGEQRHLSLLMADLRGFTALSESLGAADVVHMLNNYLGTMTEVVQAHGGVIDEIIGDALLVLFGAPLPRPDHADRALACALAMQCAMAGVNAWNRARGLPRLEMGIGVNTGEVVVGNIGSERRSKYAAVGRQVNLTGRIESFTHGGQVLISEAARRAASCTLTLGDSRTIEAKGLDTPLRIHALYGIGPPWSLRLPAEPAAALRPLSPPLPVRSVLLESKIAHGPAFDAELCALSGNEAVLRLARSLPALAQLKLTLAEDTSQVLYARLSAACEREARTGDWTCRLRLGALPPALQARLRAEAGD